MNALLGVIFHFLGGFASGSFYMPYKKVKGWQWETFWLIGGLFSWIIVPPLAAFLTIPNFWCIIQSESSSIIGFTFLFGALWGIGGFMYGLGVRYLGVALGSSIMLGLTMVIGSLLPSIYYEFNPQDGKDNIGLMLSSEWGKMVLLGLLVCVIGIIISGKAGVMKDKELQTDAVDPHGVEVKTEYKFGLGLIVAIIGIALGILLVIIVEDIIQKRSENSFTKSAILLGISIAVHNFPEGLALGSSFLAISDFGSVLALAMLLHNIPEGISMAIPMKINKTNPIKIVLLTILTGIPTGIGTFIGAYMGMISNVFISLCLSFAGGTMLYIITDEIIPNAKTLHSGRASSLGIVLGFVIGLILYL